MNIPSASRAPVMRHYAVHYNPEAPRGLPPAVEAHSVMKYCDASGSWLCFLMEPPASSTAQEPLAVLRVPTHQVASYEEFPSAAQAMAVGVSGHTRNQVNEP